jgi:hypothetical protein
MTRWWKLGIAILRDAAGCSSVPSILCTELHCQLCRTAVTAVLTSLLVKGSSRISGSRLSVAHYVVNISPKEHQKLTRRLSMSSTSHWMHQ